MIKFDSLISFYVFQQNVELAAKIIGVIIALVLMILCNLFCCVYHAVMMRDETNKARLLNIFYGHMAMIYQALRDDNSFRVHIKLPCIKG